MKGRKQERNKKIVETKKGREDIWKGRKKEEGRAIA